jgi:DNA-binding LacI/PurR family transcriptional regulator
MNRISAKTTLRDVAKAAGVASSTVSRALADDSRISEEVRAKVRAVAARLNYTPNALARGLSGNGPKAVAFIVPKTAEYEAFGTLHLSMLRGFSRVVTEEGQLLLLSLGEDRSYLELVASGLCQGLVVVTNRLGDSRLADLARHRVPAVLLPGDPSLNLPRVNFDNRQGAILATRHLLAIGHRRIAFVGGDPTSLFHTERLEGFAAALAEAGLFASPEHIRVTNFTAQGGFEEGLTILSGAGAPTAVVCVNDLVASGVVAACGRLGYSVPEDVSLVSAASSLEQPLAAPLPARVITDLDIAGAEAARLLFRLLAGRASWTTEIRFPVRFELGKSTGAPKQASSSNRRGRRQT